MTNRDIPRLSVVVLSYNGMEHLPECFGSIRAQTFRDFELIVVDNGSKDGSPDWIRSHFPEGILTVLQENEGFCRGMNRGVQMARGELVLLLNQDLKLDPDCVAGLVSAFDHPPVDSLREQATAGRPVLGVFPKVLFYSLPGFINSFGAEWYESCHWRDSRVGLPDLGAFTESETVFGAIFPAVLFHRQRFMDIGLFDDRFWSYCEDFDVCYRGNILGYRFVTAPDARIWHKYRASSRDGTDPLWSRFWFLRNYLLVFLKNYESANLRKYGRMILRRYIGNGLRHAWNTRNRAELILYLRVFGSLLKHVPHVLKSRRFIGRHRRFRDELFWNRGQVEDYNIYHVEGSVVLSLKSMQAGKTGDRKAP